MPLLPKKIGDLSVDYISLDDASDPTASVTNFKKLISENKVDAIIGPTGSPNAMGVIQFAAESGTPMLAPVGTAAVVLPMTEQKKWVFKTTQNDDLIAQALVDHMVGTGVKTVAFIGLNDPYGENWYRVFSGLAKTHGIQITANERYQRADSSVTGQALKVMASHPDAVLIAAPGGASVLPESTLYDLGYKGRFYQTHGAALPDFLKLGGRKVEGTVLAASLMLVLPEIPDSNPSKKVATTYIDAYQKLNGTKPAPSARTSTMRASCSNVRCRSRKKAGRPGTPAFRSALRDALEQTRDLVGTQGIYNMSSVDHSGFDDRGRVLITVKNGNWALIK